MEERMKSIKQKNDGYGTFCRNILNITYRKDGRNQSKYSRPMLPEFKSFRALRDNKFSVEKNTKIIPSILQFRKSSLL
jgi:hypothetical protein